MKPGEILTDKRPATIGFVAAVLQDISKRIGAVLQKDRERGSVLEERISGLEKRITELEARPSVKYLGIWTEGDRYADSDFVTDRGSLWACCRTGTTARPGDNDDWQLAAKRGRDGRDARPPR